MKTVAILGQQALASWRDNERLTAERRAIDETRAALPALRAADDRERRDLTTANTLRQKVKIQSLVGKATASDLARAENSSRRG